MPLTKICSKLRKDKDYRRKRDMKSLVKGSYADKLHQTAE